MEALRIFLADPPVQDTWLHVERDIAADLVALANPGGVSDPENFFVEAIVIRFIVPDGAQTVYLDDLRIQQLPEGGHFPLAHAGDDQTVEGGASVDLDGTFSWDADGDPLGYSWT